MFENLNVNKTSAYQYPYRATAESMVLMLKRQTGNNYAIVEVN